MTIRGNLPREIESSVNNRDHFIRASVFNRRLIMQHKRSWMNFALSPPYFLTRQRSVCGVMVSIGASQALDPGSIPGRRKFFWKIEYRSRYVIPRGCTVLHRVGGVKVSIVAFQAIDPGSIPGWRIFLKIFSSRLWGHICMDMYSRLCVWDGIYKYCLRRSRQPYPTKYSHAVSSHYTEREPLSFPLWSGMFFVIKFCFSGITCHQPCWHNIA